MAWLAGLPACVLLYVAQHACRHGSSVLVASCFFYMLLVLVLMQGKLHCNDPTCCSPVCSCCCCHRSGQVPQHAAQCANARHPQQPPQGSRQSTQVSVTGTSRYLDASGCGATSCRAMSVHCVQAIVRMRACVCACSVSGRWTHYLDSIHVVEARRWQCMGNLWSAGV